jgi:pyrimidine-nucleoside phosphorylase/thymidine phosphorylase
MRAVDLIRKKRDGGTLDRDEIRWLVSGLLSGEVAHYQWSALLMAVVWRGMDAEETVALTQAMLESGVVVDLSGIAGKKVDKHSTGGVGDKTSLILAPVAAACGVPVPMVSGRGLGHTGGTLDKLESIPGFSVHLDLAGYRRVLEKCGLVLIGQTAEIAPADKVLYALRDATATVESIPLISASIMSKKLAEGIDGLVLDVKFGNGAFLPEIDKARKLARTMCDIGRGLGKEVVALLTRMDQPLGLAVGNAVEVEECLACLKGNGPADLMELSLELAAEMVVMGGVADSLEAARVLCQRVIAEGTALERFRRLIEAQGGDPRVVDQPGRLPRAAVKEPITAARSGYVQAVSARPIGHAVMLLGAGRHHVDSKVDLAVGLLLNKKLGDRVEAGETLAWMLRQGPSRAVEEARWVIAGAYVIGDSPPAPSALIVERIEG